MDPVLAGVMGIIIGGLFTSFANWLANHFALKREEKLWQRQEEAKLQDWERELKQKKLESELNRIDSTVLELLGELSNFRHWEITDIEKASGCPIQQAYTNLQVKHYAWERAIWSRLDSDGHKKIKEIRKRFEDFHTPDGLKGHISDLSDNILSLSRAAKQN